MTIKRCDRVSVSPFESAFFYLAMSLLPYEATFLGQLYFRKSYFFTVSTSLEQLLFQSNQFGTTVTFSESSLFRAATFSGTVTFSLRTVSDTSAEKLLLENRCFFRIATSLEQLLFRRTNWVRTNKRAFYSKRVLLHSIRFLGTATFSTKVLL